MLKEYEFLLDKKRIILESIQSNRIGIKLQFNAMNDLMVKNIDDIDWEIEFDICLEKINAYIAIAFLNLVEEHEIEFKYITRLPKLLFRMHLNKLKILRCLTINGIFNHLISLPAEIGLLNNLTELTVSDCHLSILPREIGHLNNLIKLDLDGNLFTTLPKEIGELTSLKELSISNNPVLSSLPTEIGDLSALEVLNLHDDKLASIPSSFSRLQALKEINLDHNQLIKVPPELSKLSHLRRIRLRHNRLQELSLVLSLLTDLEEIDVDENDIHEFPSEFRRYIH
jgi:Leucine-rich repeat (LRR) protein